MRAEGGFATVCTAAAFVHPSGASWPGQISIASDEMLTNLSALAGEIREKGSVPIVQLTHEGVRAAKKYIDGPLVAPSDHEETGAVGLSPSGVSEIISAFVGAARRAKRAGFEGVEVHGAHGYLLAEFISEEFNRRTDAYGGNAENRWRIIFEILEKIHTACGEDFLLAVRLSPERWGLDLGEIKHMAQRMFDNRLIDLLDMSLWDFAKKPDDRRYADRSLIEHFCGLDKNGASLAVSGNIRSAVQAREVISAGADVVMVGRAAIFHHDFPRLVAQDDQFKLTAAPAKESYLRREGVSASFIKYLRHWPDLVADD